MVPRIRHIVNITVVWMQKLNFDVFFVHVAEVVISPLHLTLLLIVDYGAVTGENGLVDALVRVVGLLVGVFDFDG